MNGITFIRDNGELLRELPGEDHISGLIVYGETAVAKIEVSSVEDLKKIGITSTSHPITHYHVSEFYRMNPGAILFLEVVVTSDGNFTELKVLQNFAKGKIRQLAICDFKTQVSSLKQNVAKLNGIAVTLGKAVTPLSILYTCKIETSEMTSLPDLHEFNAPRVSVLIAQDGNGLGAKLHQKTPCVGSGGTVLGALSRARVHESIGWVEKQNLVTQAYSSDLDLEYDVAAFIDGTKTGDYTLEQLESLNKRGYLFLRHYPGIAGTYLNDSFTATATTSDYAYIENNRTIDKAIRNINRVVVPKVSGPVYIDPDTGDLEATNIKALEALCEEPLDQMKREGELSGYRVFINPKQKVLQNSKLEVIVKIVPVGTLREIEVKIGLALQL